MAATMNTHVHVCPSHICDISGGVFIGIGDVASHHVMQALILFHVDDKLWIAAPDFLDRVEYVYFLFEVQLLDDDGGATEHPRLPISIPIQPKLLVQYTITRNPCF